MYDKTNIHVVEYSTLFLVWLGVLVLTALTVTVAGLNLGAFNVVTALAVAITKASLVLFFFMHLKYEDRIFRVMVLLTLVILTVIICLTFLETFFRGAL